MLPTSADGPAECLDLMSMTFRCMALDVMAKTPQYGAVAVIDCDFEPAYRYHRRVLKLLQWHRPPSRWRIKTPAHLLSIEALEPRVSRGALRDHAPRRHQGHPVGRERRDRGGAHDDGQSRPARTSASTVPTRGTSACAGSSRSAIVSARSASTTSRSTTSSRSRSSRDPRALRLVGRRAHARHRRRDGGVVEDQQRGTRAGRRTSLPRRRLRARSRPTRRAVRLLRSTIPDREPPQPRPRSMS